MAENPVNFNDLLGLITDGEPVSAGTANRPILGLDQRTRYLWDLLRAAATGSAVFARQVTVEAAAVPGNPVYFNTATNRFERALSGVVFDPTTSGLVTADSAGAWGVVFQKIDAGTADILLLGYAELDLAAVMEAGESVGPGSYYLSRSSAGKLTRKRPPVAVPVLRADGNGMVFVNPRWDDLLSSHTHLHFALLPVPAGHHRDPGTGNRHTITSPNPHVEGWLPADAAVFNGNAPADARFGYNISANAALKAAWPPLPPDSAVLLQDGAQVSSGAGGLVVFDRNGIWWMSDCYDNVPFPAQESTDFITVSESVPVSESPDLCPFPYQMRLDLYFTQFEFSTDTTVVTSLTSTDPRLEVFCAGQPGVAAEVGPLQVALKLNFLVDAVDPGGWMAIKSFDAEHQLFHFGPVTSGVFAAGSNVRLTSDFQTTENISSTPTTIHHGRVGIDVDTALNREMPTDLVRLDGATEEYFEDVPYLSFAAGAASQLRVRLNIPETLDVVGPKLTIKLRLLGLAAGTLPALTVTARRLPLADAVPALLPNADSAVVINTAVTLPIANQYVDIEATAFAVVAGDDVLFTVARSASDAYAGELGILRMTGIVTAS